MKYIFSLLLLLLFSCHIFAQYDYEPTADQPFGKLNPVAFPQTGDYEALIGISTCKSQSRASDGTWNNEVDMIWKWKYIMNGMAVQDETLKADDLHSGSIRQFNADSAKWYVHYYASATAVTSLPVWGGSKTEEGKIVLYRDQKSPNGLDGFYRLTFSEITNESFNWIGEWVNTEETIVYPTWKIKCEKIKS
ncbi:MAG: hypothetical protein JXR20_07110 [Balneola sp.]